MPELHILRLIGSHLPRIAVAALIAALAELSGIALIATAAWLLASAAAQPPLTALTVAIVAVRTFAISRGILRYLDRLVGHDAVLRAMAELRARMFRALTPLAPSGAKVFRSGDLLTRLVSDVDSVQDLVLRVVTPVWTAAVVCVVSVGFVAAFSPLAALVLAGGLIVTGVVLPLIAGGLAAAASRRTAAGRGGFAAATVDLVSGAQDLAAYGATDMARARAVHEAEVLAAAERRGAAVSAAVTGTGTVVAGFSVLGVLLVAPDLGVMSAVLALTALVTFESTAVLPAAARRLTEVRSAAARLVELLNATPTVADPAEPVELPGEDHRLRLRGVRPELPGRPAPQGGVDLDLVPGRRVAIVGASGAGKTMLFNALVRFTGLAGGSIELAGVDITALRGEDVRRVIGGMMSDAHLFGGTVEQNLRIARPAASEAELDAVLRRAGLRELELSTLVGRDGAEISGGQRQRLLLARALLADHPIMLLDEPTEHLDAETSDAIMADLLDATVGHSLLLVTHRITGLDAFDEILVLDSGGVIERGTPSELAARDGVYRHMWGTFQPVRATT